MRLLIVLLTAALASSCTAPQKDGSPPARASGSMVASQMADAYIKRLSPPPTGSDSEEIHRDFSERFLEGFASLDANLSGSDAAEHGFQAGQEFRRKVKAGEINQTMKDFGYLATEADGTWVIDAGTNCFSPKNVRDQRWHVDQFRNAKFILPKGVVASDHVNFCHVSGFLSPQGKYDFVGDYYVGDHILGADYEYDHEFYVTKVVLIKNGD
jgi:hypothetical protein